MATSINRQDVIGYLASLEKEYSGRDVKVYAGGNGFKNASIGECDKYEFIDYLHALQDDGFIEMLPHCTDYESFDPLPVIPIVLKSGVLNFNVCE